MGKPTLRCACDGAYCAVEVEYHERPAGETPFPLAGGTYYRAYQACRVCGHFFGMQGDSLPCLYAGAYVDATYGSIDAIRTKFQAIMAYPPERSDNYWRVKRVDEQWRRGPANSAASRPRLLDVGTGLAVFPAGMQRAGWDCTIVDPDPRAVAHAREECGLAAFCGDFLELAASDLGQYDVITFNKVLEHVEDPGRFLEKARRHTLAEGLVYIEVPDVHARHDGAGFQREEFFVEHLHVFSPASLCHLVERSGLKLHELHRLREPSGKYTLTAFASRPNQSGLR